MPTENDPTIDGDPRCPACGKGLPAAGAECVGCAATIAPDPSNAPTISPDEVRTFTGPMQIAHYRVIRELGAGGMGTVFEAHDERMNRNVALKVLSRHQAPSGKAELRFEREAWIAGKLEHPALVKVYDRGSWEELSYYSMELVHGGSLHDVIGNMQHWGRDDRLGLEFGTGDYVNWAVRMVVDAARGLDYAHRQGIVHRDIKPMNLLFSEETKSVKIADFGLAIDTAATRMTTAGTVLGTLAYMAPEQILGKQEEICPATDVYALGVTLFEMLTLSFPFSGKTQQIYMNAVLTTEARRPRKLNERVSRDLETVIRKALEKTPRDRYATAGDLADDLEAVLRFRPIHARPPGNAERLIKWTRRRPIHAALIGVLVVGVPTVAFLGQRAIERRQLLRTERIVGLEQDVRLLWQQGRVEDLIAPASEILEIDPDHRRTLQRRGFSYKKLAEQTQGEAEAADLRRRSLDDVSRLVELEPDAAWTHNLKAIVLRASGRIEEAVAAEEIASTLRTDDPNENDLYFDGFLAMDRGESEQAAELFTEAIVMRPSRPDLLLARAGAYEAIGRTQDAVQDYRLVVALNPDDLLGTLGLGRTLRRAGSVEEGKRYQQKALEIRPDLAHEEFSHYSLVFGQEAMANGDVEAARALFEEAERHARKSIEIEPGGVWSHLNLGGSLMEQNRLLADPDPELIEEAVDHYQEAMRLSETKLGREAELAYAAALVNSCDALIQADLLDRALEACTEMTEQLPDEADAFYNLAGVYALLGRADEAFAALEKDFELGDKDWRYLEADGWFASVRDDARFAELIERMKR
jgi:serine/threonine protein kinase/tetratricopeptide (TPR) repeat protein